MNKIKWLILFLFIPVFTVNSQVQDVIKNYSYDNYIYWITRSPARFAQYQSRMTEWIGALSFYWLAMYNSDVATADSALTYINEVFGTSYSRADIPYFEASSTINYADSVPANETDPVYSASQAANIDATDITNLGNLSGTNTGDQDLSSYPNRTELGDTASAIRSSIGSGGGEVDTSGLPVATELTYFATPIKIGSISDVTNAWFKGNSNYITGYGYNALSSIVDQGESAGNTAIGYNAAPSLAVGQNNISIGYQSMYNGTSISSSMAIGYNALYTATTNMTTNIAIGNYSLYSATTNCNNNTAIGNTSLNSLTTGDYNLAIGLYSGRYLTTESNMIILNTLNRSNKSGDTTLSPIVVRQAATAANQQLYFNGNVNISNDLAVNGNITLHDSTIYQVIVANSTGGTAQPDSIADYFLANDSSETPLLIINDTTGSFGDDTVNLSLKIIGGKAYGFIERYTDAGSGTGDMLASTYDPQNIQDDAFDLAVHTGQIDTTHVLNLDEAISDNTDVTANSAFTATPSSVITAGTGIDWSGNTLNVTVSGGASSADTIYETSNDTVYALRMQNIYPPYYSGDGRDSIFIDTTGMHKGKTVVRITMADTTSAADTMGLDSQIPIIYKASKDTFWNKEDEYNQIECELRGFTGHYRWYCEVVDTQYIASATGGGGFSDVYQNLYDNYFVIKPLGDTAVWQDTLINRLYKYGYWEDSLDYFHLWVQNDSVNAKINLVNPSGPQTIGRHQPIYHRYGGVNASGTDTATAINLQWNPTSDGVHWTINSACWGVVILDDVSTGSTFDFGVENTPGYDNALATYYGGQIKWAINTSNGYEGFWGSNGTDGIWISVRHNADSMTLYRNIDQNIIQKTATAGLPTRDFFLLKANGNDEENINSSTRRIGVDFGGSKISTVGIERISGWIDEYLQHFGLGLLP